MHMFDSEVAGREEDRSLSERPTSWMGRGGREGWRSVHHASAPKARCSRRAARTHPSRIDNIKRERSASGHKQEVDDSHLEAWGLMVEGRRGEEGDVQQCLLMRRKSKIADYFTDFCAWRCFQNGHGISKYEQCFCRGLQ